MRGSSAASRTAVKRWPPRVPESWIEPQPGRDPDLLLHEQRGVPDVGVDPHVAAPTGGDRAEVWPRRGKGGIEPEYSPPTFTSCSKPARRPRPVQAAVNPRLDGADPVRNTAF